MKDLYDDAINRTVPLFRAQIVNNTLQDAWATVASLREIADAAGGLGSLADWFWKQRYYPWSDCMVRQHV